jgi:hypothetical protein
MANYSSTINGQALSVTLDTMTIITTATGQGSAVALKELYLSGESSASAYNRVVLNRPGSVGVTPVVVAVTKLHPASVTPLFTVASNVGGNAWTTNPVISATDILIPGLNTFAGQMHWYALPGCEVIVGTQGAVANLSLRSRSGTSTISGHMIIEEY